jgi:hypothetical protein
MDTLKDILSRYGRPFLVKIVLRAIGYGLSVGWIAKGYAILAPVAGTPTQPTSADAAGWADMAAGLTIGVVMAVIDYYQHKADKAETPPAV